MKTFLKNVDKWKKIDNINTNGRNIKVKPKTKTKFKMYFSFPCHKQYNWYYILYYTYLV